MKRKQLSKIFSISQVLWRDLFDSQHKIALGKLFVVKLASRWPLFVRTWIFKQSLVIYGWYMIHANNGGSPVCVGTRELQCGLRVAFISWCSWRADCAWLYWLLLMVRIALKQENCRNTVLVHCCVLASGSWDIQKTAPKYALHLVIAHRTRQIQSIKTNKE